MIDRLERIFMKQHELQQRLNYKMGDMYKNQKFINVMTIAAISELIEAIHETPWKPWKKRQEFNLIKFREEIIDAWHFLINLSIAAGFNANTLTEGYMDKNTINFKRQDDGY